MPRTIIRPGFVIRDVLTGRQPILPENTLGYQAAPTDLYRTYKMLIKAARRDGSTDQRGMSRHSFTGLLYQARRLGLIIPAGEEIAGVPTAPAARRPLLNINTASPERVSSAGGSPIDVYSVVEARRLLYQIGSGGVDLSPAWSNIPRYYMRLVETLKGA